MYKVSLAGKTMVGCNHDTWFETPKIWFETQGYGAGFTGARMDGANGCAPQSGMNEYGLVFSRLATATPASKVSFEGKKQIVNPTLYLKDILHTCKTIEDVQKYIDQYDHSYFSQDVFIYIDRSGKYLVVEPYKMTIGTDQKYVLANFCPSTISDFSTIKQVRYLNGELFLKDKIDTSLEFCTALSDTMHVCRKKIGDGTLLTSIWDNSEGTVSLYFYHDYKTSVQFSLKQELEKGNHQLDIPTLFPTNKEFLQLSEFKTPLNSPTVSTLLLIFFLGFFLIGVVFSILYFRKRKTTPFPYLMLSMIPLSFLLSYYMFALSTDINIFFFPAPYADYQFSLLTIASYLPFLLLILILPFLWVNKKLFKERSWPNFPKWIFTISNAMYLVMICLFVYWGFYNVIG